ncbi:MAG: helix-turn-helix domain-containing protein [Oscillospiraceae bacterium]|nr:helix-turn-helix domain-containing protein [Oscillospiraceae bacterium]
MGEINGIKFFRQKNRINNAQLAERAGVSVATIIKLEKKIDKKTKLSTCKAIADALGVSIEMLLDNYDESDLLDGDNRRTSKRKEFGSSEIAVYCSKHNLTFQQLADRLGMKSRERARQLCQENEAKIKHIKRLAAYEGLSIEEFCELYAA